MLRLMRMFLSAVRISRQPPSITIVRRIFCKNLPLLRRQTFGLTFFGMFSTIIDGSLDFRLVRRRWSEHRRRVHCHTWSMTALVSIVSDNAICVSSIDGNQHLYGKIAITPNRMTDPRRIRFSCKRTPRIEKYQPQNRYIRIDLRFYIFGYCHVLTL